LIFRDDHAGENLAFVEDLEALFIEALFERELVFEFFCWLRYDIGASNT
jgi:hypothetical protein